MTLAAGDFRDGVRDFPIPADTLTIVYAAGIAGESSFGFVVDEISLAPEPEVSLVRVTHALPLDDSGTVVDVFAGALGGAAGDAGLVADDLVFGTTVGPLALPEGDYTVYLAAPGAFDDGVLADAEVLVTQDLFVPGGLNLSAVASFDADGVPGVRAFVNDDSGVRKGKGRLSIRHAAKAPEVEVRVGLFPWARFFPFLAQVFPAANGQQGDLELRSGRYDVEVSAGDFSAGVEAFPVPSGQLTAVYAAGVAGEPSFTFVVDELDL